MDRITLVLTAGDAPKCDATTSRGWQCKRPGIFELGALHLCAQHVEAACRPDPLYLSAEPQLTAPNGASASASFGQSSPARTAH
jgi:hypothetical protein